MAVLRGQRRRRVFVVDTVRGRRQKPHQIAERVLSRLDVHHPSYLYTMADSYSFQSKKERDDNTPTIAELLIPHGIVLTQATAIDRKKGLTNLRYYTAWKGINIDGTDGLPGPRVVRHAGQSVGVRAVAGDDARRSRSRRTCSRSMPIPRPAWAATMRTTRRAS
jgi:hypothetical protein